MLTLNLTNNVFQGCQSTARMLPPNEEIKMMPSEPEATTMISDEIDGKVKIVTYFDDNKRQNLRMRRTKSVARAEEITKEAEKVRKSQPDKP